MMNTGNIPAHDDCWQCYHPPVFYGISALTGRLALAGGVKPPQLPKLLQFLVCLYGILTLGILAAILNRLPVSEYSRLIAFGTACFLPRHIYMSALHSNDAISYLFVSLSVYLLLLAIDKKLPVTILSLTSVVMTLTLFTKFTSFVILPVGLCAFALLAYYRLFASQKQAALTLVMVFLIPAASLGVFLGSNLKTTGSALPWNVEQLDPSRTQPRDQEQMDFFSFKPWDCILGPPMLAPGKIHSFWTLVYSGMWFDNEPKFLFYLDVHPAWWKHYYAWLRGEKDYPGDNRWLSALTRFTAMALLSLGLVPFGLILIGGYRYFQGLWKQAVNPVDQIKLSLFPTLLFFNVIGMIALAIRLPVFSAAKATYLLNSLSAFCVLLCLGLMPLEMHRRRQSIFTIIFSVIFFLSGLHILEIVSASWS